MYICIHVCVYVCIYIYIIYIYVCVYLGMYVCLSICMHCRRRFRSQTSNNVDRWKAEMGRVREKRRVEERRSEKRKSQKKEDAGARKGRKVAKHCDFRMICGSGGSKSRLTKAAGAEPDERWKIARRCGAKHISKSKCTKHTSSGPLLEVEMSKKCMPLWREAHLQVKKLKTPHFRSTFGSWDVQKVHAVVARSTFQSQNVQNTPFSDHFWNLRCRKGHAVVARSTFQSQNVQNTPFSDHFWKLRCRKSARRCGAKHISKSKCEKHDMFAPLLDVEMSFRVAGARDGAPCQKWAKREGLVAFPKTMTGVGHWRGSAKMHFPWQAQYKGCSSEMLGGQGADFLRRVAFRSIRSSGLLKWFCVTGATLRMTWHHFFVAVAVL